MHIVFFSSKVALRCNIIFNVYSSYISTFSPFIEVFRLHFLFHSPLPFFISPQLTRCSSMPDGLPVNLSKILLLTPRILFLINFGAIFRPFRWLPCRFPHPHFDPFATAITTWRHCGAFVASVVVVAVVVYSCSCLQLIVIHLTLLLFSFRFSLFFASPCLLFAYLL